MANISPELVALDAPRDCAGVGVFAVAIGHPTLAAYDARFYYSDEHPFPSGRVDLGASIPEEG
jgi:hypothetical protein